MKHATPRAAPVLLLFGWMTCRALLGLPELAAQTTGRTTGQTTGQPNTAMLYLKNRDYVAGRLEPSDSATSLRWRSPLFQEPIEFDIRGVERIGYAPVSAREANHQQERDSITEGLVRLLNQLPHPPARALPVEGARIELAGGHILVGTLERLDEQYLEIDSSRHGKLRVKRSQVVSVDGLAASRPLLFDGSGQLAEWSVLRPADFSIDDWQVVGRELVTTRLGANLFYEPVAGKRFLYEIELAGRGQPQFQLVFGIANSPHHVRQGFSIETWGSELVIHRQPGQKVVHRSLAPVNWTKPRWSLRLEVYFDGQEKRLIVNSGGRRLGELHTGGQSATPGRGFMIRNRGAALHVARARVHSWVGPAPPSREVVEDVVALTDGLSVGGRIRSYERAGNQLEISTATGPRTLDVSTVEGIRLARPDAEPAADRPSAPMLVSYLDGGALSGRYLRTDESGLWLSADFCDEPVRAGWKNLRQVHFNCGIPPELPPNQTGLVEHGQTVLHGRMRDDGGSPGLVWEAVYSNSPLTFNDVSRMRVSFEPQHDPLPADQRVSELVLVDGDTIPCKVDAIDDEAVTVRFGDGEPVRVARDRVKAVRDFQPQNWIYSQFSPGDRWHADRNDPSSLRLREGVLEMMDTMRLAREMELPDQFRVRFDVRLAPGSSLVMGVGSDTLDHALNRSEGIMVNEELLRKAMNEPPDTLIEMTVVRSGGVFHAQGVSRAAGVLSMLVGGQMASFQQGNDSELHVGEYGAVHIEWLIDRTARQYTIVGNGRTLFHWRDPAAWQGTWFHLGCASNGEQPAEVTSTPLQPHVAIYNFRIDRWLGEMDDQRRDRFLTRRRGMSDDATTHVLRAANGDCLRGRLISMDEDEIVFQSRLETLVVPRAAMAEIITLKPMSIAPTTESPAYSGGDVVQARVVLSSGSGVRLSKLSVTDRHFMGTSPLVGAVAVPRSAVSQIHFGDAQPVQTSSLAHWVLREPPPLPVDEQPSAVEPSVWLHRPAPDFTLTTLDGEKLSLADLRGRPVMLDFWATWCGPCIASMPTMIEIGEEFQGKAELIAINQQEDPEEVREFVASRRWNLRVGLDPDGSLNRLFGITAIPYTMVLDREGVVRHVHVGASPELKAELTDALRKLVP